MRNSMIKVLAFAMTAVMTLSTPMTASAAGIIPEIFGTDKAVTLGTGTATDTTTITTSNTNTKVLTEAEDAEVMGLQLNVAELNMRKGDVAKVTANILFSNKGDDQEALEALLMEKRLKWYKVYTGDNKDAVGIKFSDGDPRNVLTVTAKAGGSVKVVAKLDVDLDGTADYEASATINVKEYATSLSFVNAPAKGYVKHVIDMNKYLDKGSKTATDKIAWVVDNAKNATIADNGMLTLKKADTKVKVTAISEKGLTASTEIAIELGKPATKLEGNVKKAELVIQKKATTDKSAESAALSVKVTPADTTDIIAWDYGNAKSANFVTIVPDAKDQTKATVVAKAVGTAKVVAKATSGKKATFTVKVTTVAPEVDYVTGKNKIYVGQKTQLKAVLNPAQSTQKVKWTISGYKFGAKINAKGILTASKKEAGVVTVVASTGKKNNDPAKNTYSEKLYAVTVMPSTISKDDASKMDITVGTGENVTKVTKTTQKAYVGKAKDYNTTIDALSNNTGKAQVEWTASGKAASVAGAGTVTALKPGTSTIKASVVARDGKAYNKTVKAKVQQAVTGLQMAKSAITVVPKVQRGATVDQKIKVKVAKQLPKNATKEVITWTIAGADTITLTKTDSANANKSMTAEVTVSKAAKLGDSVVLTATSASGAKATTVITVLNKTDKVQFKNNKGEAVKKVQLGIAESTTFSSEVISAAGTNLDTNEKVTYTVTDKKGVVSIVDNQIVGLKKGTAKIKATTPSGKNATLTIQVK